MRKQNWLVENSLVTRYLALHGVLPVCALLVLLPGAEAIARAEVQMCASIVCLPKPEKKDVVVQHQGAGLALSALQLYQQRISPLIGPKCGFKPSCSRYSVQVIRDYGMLRGLVMTADRLLRCHYCAGLYYPRERGLLLDPVLVHGDDEE